MTGVLLWLAILVLAGLLTQLHGVIRWQATDFGLDNKDTVTGVEHNRVVRITTWADSLAEVDADVPVYIWQIENAPEPAPGRLVFHGVPDAALSVIPIIEGARPWCTPART